MSNADNIINKHLSDNKLKIKLQKEIEDNSERSFHRLVSSIEEDILGEDEIIASGIKRNEVYNTIINRIQNFWSGFIKSYNYIHKK